MEADKVMKKPIVVGVVDTQASRAALAWAMNRAARRKLPVLLVHAVDSRWLDESVQFQRGDQGRSKRTAEQNRSICRRIGAIGPGKNPAVPRQPRAGTQEAIQRSLDGSHRNRAQLARRTRR